MPNTTVMGKRKPVLSLDLRKNQQKKKMRLLGHHKRNMLRKARTPTALAVGAILVVMRERK
jgi:hypothetical protein